MGIALTTEGRAAAQNGTLISSAARVSLHTGYPTRTNELSGFGYRRQPAGAWTRRGNFWHTGEVEFPVSTGIWYQPRWAGVLDVSGTLLVRFKLLKQAETGRRSRVVIRGLAIRFSASLCLRDDAGNVTRDREGAFADGFAAGQAPGADIANILSSGYAHCSLHDADGEISGNGYARSPVSWTGTSLAVTWPSSPVGDSWEGITHFGFGHATQAHVELLPISSIFDADDVPSFMDVRPGEFIRLPRTDVEADVQTFSLDDGIVCPPHLRPR